MKKHLFALLLAVCAAAQAEVCINVICSGDEERERQAAAELSAELQRSQTLLEPHRFAGLVHTQQTWETFVKEDCRYNHTRYVQYSRHTCFMKHYRDRLEELRQRNDLFIKSMQ